MEGIIQRGSLVLRLLLSGRVNQGDWNGQDICTLRINEKCAKDLNRKPQGKRPLARPRRAWEYNFKMDLNGNRGEMLIGFKWFRVMSNDRIVGTQ
jgi:hypothetical protein